MRTGIQLLYSLNITQPLADRLSNLIMLRNCEIFILFLRSSENKSLILSFRSLLQCLLLGACPPEGPGPGLLQQGQGALTGARVLATAGLMENKFIWN